MNDYEIGAALRKRLQRDQQQGGTPEGRRLQALVGDLCGDDPRLLPAMRYMVSWEPFQSEAARRPPLTDPRLASRLRQELREIFAMPVCERMDAVVRGLLDLPEAATPAPAPAPRSWGSAAPQRAQTAPVPQAPPPAAEERRGTLGGVVMLCLGAFLAGGLLALAVGFLIPLRQEPVEPTSEPAMPEARVPPAAAVAGRIPAARRV
jgi:hypothetical protein